MSVLATESFTGSNADPIGGNWTTIDISDATSTSIKRVSNLAVQSTPGGGGDVSGGAAYYNAVSPPADQYVKITINNINTGGNYWPHVRVNNASKDAYTALFDCGANLGANFRVAIVKYLGDSFSIISSIVAWNNVTPSVLEIRAVGSTISAWQDGVQLVSTTDTDITAAGRGGFRLFGTAAISDFEMGDFTGGAFLSRQFYEMIGRAH